MRRAPLFLLLALACSPVEPPVVEASPLSDTTDTAGPYAVSARVRARRSISRVELVWHDAAVGPGQAQRTQMTEDAATGVWQGSIPGLGRGAVVAWHVEATDASGDVGYAPPTAVNGPRCGDEFCFTVLPAP